MTTVTLDDTNQALMAGAWCKDHVDKWDINIRNLFGPHTKYDFYFASAEDATMFALKWL